MIKRNLFFVGSMLTAFAFSLTTVNANAPVTSSSVMLVNIVSNPYISTILLAIGFIGFLVEIFTTGFGLGGTASLISFALYFGGNILAGNTSWLTLLIFFVGIMLLLIEAFVPGFGIPGVGGVLCMVLSIILASSNAVTAIISLLIAFILTIVVFVLILKYAPRSKHFDRIILKTKLDKNKGFVSVKNYEPYLDRVGETITPLRPSGTISIDGELLDVVSEGQFIDKGALVKVSRVEGRKIVVQKIK